MMKKLLLSLLLVLGLTLVTVSVSAQDDINNDTTEIKEETTPEANRKPFGNNAIIQFGAFALFVVIVGVGVTMYNRRGVFHISDTQMNGDGSYTLTVRSNSIKKMMNNPDDVHVIIRKGTCIFLKKPDFSKRLTRKDDLFIVVVNENSQIEFMYKDDTFMIDGGNLGKSLKLKNSTI